MAKPFVLQHHYSESFLASRMSVGYFGSLPRRQSFAAFVPLLCPSTMPQFHL